MDVLTFETRLALNNEIIKQVTSSWSIFIKITLSLSQKMADDKRSVNLINGRLLQGL